MLYESNRFTYFCNKYFPLLVSIAFFGLSFYSFFAPERAGSSSNFFDSIAYLVFSVVAFYVFHRQRPKWKIVALNRMRIVVGTGKTETEYTWLEVESVHLSRWMGIYTLHLKNGMEILFTAYRQTNIFTGDTSEMGTIIAKMKRDLGL